MITTEVAFARSTWRKSKEFSAGLHDLAQRMPMELVRLYVTEGVRTPRVRIDYYDRIDELRALRREALLAEMRHVEAQAECWLEEHPDEAARIEMQYMEYKKGNDMARYMHDLKYTLAHVEGTRACSLECRAAKSSCWINWQGILTPCVMLDQPAVDLKKIPMTTAWQQLLEEAKELVSHTECEGCHLRPVCNVCYAAAHCEKTITGSMDYLCQMAKAKERIITNYPPVIH